MDPNEQVGDCEEEQPSSTPGPVPLPRKKPYFNNNMQIPQRACTCPCQNLRGKRLLVLCALFLLVMYAMCKTCGPVAATPVPKVVML